MNVSPIANRPVVRPTTNAAPAKPAQAPKPVAKPEPVAKAQGAIAVAHNVFTAACGAIGLGGLGAVAGYCAYLFSAGAVSPNFIGVGLLVGAIGGGLLGWFSGQERGKALENWVKG